MQGKHPDRLFTIVYLPINFLTLLVVVIYPRVVPTGWRIVSGMVMFCISVAVVPMVRTWVYHRRM